MDVPAKQVVTLGVFCRFVHCKMSSLQHAQTWMPNLLDMLDNERSPVFLSDSYCTVGLIILVVDTHTVFFECFRSYLLDGQKQVGVLYCTVKYQVRSTTTIVVATESTLML
jgi:hypothetical protein